MHNVWLIFRRDTSNLFRNVMSVIITVGLVLLPSLFAWYNILACWNVFDNTGNLSVAVASDDQGFSSDLMPIQVNVGEKVVSALRANDQINWVVTTSSDAIEGTKSGAYYAALVIPENFSRQMLTFYQDDAGSADIRYYVNEKVNAISPNITGAGADTVSAQVNATFAKTIAEVGTAMATSLSQQSQEDGVEGKAALLASRMRTVAQRIDESGDVLGLYSSLGRDSQSLLASSTNLVTTAKSQAEAAVANSDGDKAAVRDLAGRLAASADTVSASLDGNQTVLANLERTADELLASAADDAATVAARLRDAASQVDAKTAEANARLAVLQQLRDDLHSGLEAEIDTLVSENLAEAEVARRIEQMMERTVLLDKAISELSHAIDIMQQTSGNLTEAADNLDSGDADIRQKLASLQEAAAAAKADIEAQKATFQSTLQPGIDQLRVDLETLVADLDAVASRLEPAGSDLPTAADAAGAALGNMAADVDAARDKLKSAASEMNGLADSIDSTLASGDIASLRRLLAGSEGQLATALSTPVQVKREALFPAQNFGSAMTPLYSALALFIGALLIMVAMKPEVSQRGRQELSDPKPRHLYFGRFGVVALLSLMQTTVLGLGNMLLLKVQVADPLLFMACFWISGLVFAFMIYTLVVSFGNLGKALAVLLLIVQVTACGGSYPLPIMPDFVQALSPWVPATHVVNALRAAMFGVYQGDFWVSMGYLALFVVPFLLLGLVLRKPMERFMHFYVSKVEESGMME